MTIETGDIVCVRSRDAGVFVGMLAGRSGDEVALLDARRIWYWDGAASLSELSQLGPSRPENCKFPAAVPEALILGVCEVLPVSEVAAEAIAAVPPWSGH